MKKRLLFAIFTLFLPFFFGFIFCGEVFQLTEAQKQWFDGLENEWIGVFKKLANCDDQEMTLILDTIGAMKKQRFDYLFNTEKTEYFHDEDVPKEVLEKTYKILEKHGINPYRIDIKTKKEEKLADAEDQVAVNISFDEQDKITSINFKYPNNPTLWLYESSFIQSDEFFENTILHECGHFAETYAGQKLLLETILEEKKISQEELEAFFNIFTSIAELIADQRLTIGNKKIIENMIKEYSASKEDKKQISDLLSNSSLDNLIVDYKGGYPTYVARWLSLQKMKRAVYNA